MGSVWLAEHLTLNSWVAVKLMDPSIAATVEGAERFRREAQAAASLRSAHVVQVLDYGVHENTPFLVMELLQGQSLAECIERERRLSPARTLAIVTQVARAIGRAHAAGIVHRDLKPDNIFLVREDDQELAKVLDFGIAKTTGHRLGGMETRTGVTMGTPYYMSPEQLEGKKALDHRSDLWSLTVIACECLSGVRPFDGETYGELLLNICARPIIPPSRQGLHLAGFDEWFARGANREPSLRFGSAQELASSLADVVAGRVLPPPGVGAAVELESHADARAGSDSAGSTEAKPALLSAATTAATDLPRTNPRPLRWPLLAGAALSALVVTAAALVMHRGAPSTVASAVLPSSVPGDSHTSSAMVVAPSAPPSAGLDQPTGPEHAGQRSETSGTKTQPALSAPRPALLPATPKAPGAPNGMARPTRCFSDPFTGQVRLADAAHTSGSFACHQNPFTGALQRQ